MRREQMHVVLDVLLDMGQRLLERQAPSPEARQHFKTARREALLGVRAMVDAAIERADRPEEAPAASGRPTAIKID